MFHRFGLFVIILLAIFLFLATIQPSLFVFYADRPFDYASIVHAEEQQTHMPRLGQRASQSPPPRLTIEPYVRPELAARMETLRPVILAAAARHNRPALSGMSDREFAVVMAAMMYNEHNGWLEDTVEPLRLLTPLYERTQVWVNRSGVGSDLSVWPSNIRPSVALEILRGQVPLPEPTRVMTLPLRVAGSAVVPERYDGQGALYAAINAELTRDELAVEYLAANLERALYRAHYEGVPVSWRTLASWHNQGIVHPELVREHGWARDYVRRTSAYLPLARKLMAKVAADDGPHTPAELQPR